MQAADYHLPVLPDEVLAGLDPKPAGRFFDGTIGGGGHAALVLKAIGPQGFLYGSDQDPQALATAERRLQEIGCNFALRRGNFAEILGEWPPEPLDGILLDLGVSSHQLDTAARGFSFQREGPLDMRMDPANPTTAARLVNELSERELADLIYRWGEERLARPIARAIVRERPLATTTDLAKLIERIVPRAKDGLHPATRTFQALRLAVNAELRSLERALPLALERLAIGGRLAVISFHSLEDRMVKQFMRDEAKGCVCPPRLPVCVCAHQPRLKLLTTKPVVAGLAECAANPRARSAKLRVATRIA